MFFVLNMDDDQMFADGQRDGFSLRRSAEQEYELPSKHTFCHFLQNANTSSLYSFSSPLAPFEVFFFSESVNRNQGAVFSLCPVIPKQKVILSEAQF